MVLSRLRNPGKKVFSYISCCLWCAHDRFYTDVIVNNIMVQSLLSHNLNNILVYQNSLKQNEYGWASCAQITCKATILTGSAVVALQL